MPPEILAALQTRYGRVLDSDQANRAWGTSGDAEHTVAVRFSRPYTGHGRRILGGWYRPDELVAVIDGAGEEGQ